LRSRLRPRYDWGTATRVFSDTLMGVYALSAASSFSSGASGAR
jgi:hypothetical protein